MALSDEKPEARGVQFIKCPSCGRRYDLDRAYCDCHTRLESDVFWSDNKDIPIGGKANVEFSDFTCADCGMGCNFCYSFSMPRANSHGFGGENCVQKQNTVRCACCQAVRRIGPSLTPVKPIVMGIREMWSRRGA